MWILALKGLRGDCIEVTEKRNKTIAIYKLPNRIFHKCLAQNHLFMNLPFFQRGRRLNKTLKQLIFYPRRLVHQEF